jgi:membrane protein implicated in regulation of membrane protease activity
LDFVAAIVSAVLEALFSKSWLSWLTIFAVAGLLVWAAAAWPFHDERWIFAAAAAAIISLKGLLVLWRRNRPAKPSV